MLKFQVETLDGLDESIQKMYTEKDGKFTLAIDGLPKQEDVSGLKAKVDELLDEAKKAKKEAKDAQKEADRITAEKAEKDGDVEALKASWQKKYDTDLASANERADSLDNMLKHEKIHSQAVELATTLAVPGSADVLLPHIEKRLSMDIKDGRAVAVVMDTAGRPSALTVEELGKEIANNAAFAPLIVASNAAGGGANGTQRGGVAQTKTATREAFSAWDAQAKSKFMADGGILS